MAVTADDVAPRRLCEDLVFSSPAGHLSDDVVLRRGISMVELHDVMRKPFTTIGTRSCGQLAQEFAMGFPASAQFLNTRGSARLTQSKRGKLRVEVAISSRRMTIRTDDVAFRDFSQQQIARFQKDLSSGDRKRLVRWVAVIKVHDPRREGLTAVGTRPPAHFTKKGHRGLLASPNSLELFVPMFGVIGGVVEALILGSPHDPQLERTPCQ